MKTTVSKQRPYDVALVDTFGRATMQVSSSRMYGTAGSSVALDIYNRTETSSLRPQELDYLNEAANQLRCKTELEKRMPGKVYVPKVYNEYTTR